MLISAYIFFKIAVELEDVVFAVYIWFRNKLSISIAVKLKDFVLAVNFLIRGSQGVWFRNQVLASVFEGIDTPISGNPLGTAYQKVNS